MIKRFDWHVLWKLERWTMTRRDEFFFTIINYFTLSFWLMKLSLNNWLRSGLTNETLRCQNAVIWLVNEKMFGSRPLCTNLDIFNIEMIIKSVYLLMENLILRNFSLSQFVPYFLCNSHYFQSTFYQINASNLIFVMY